MNPRTVLGGIAVLVAALLAVVVGPAQPSAAGAWVVISLDSGVELRAGESSTVGFTVLRHGVTPETWDIGLDLILIGDDGTRLRFAAVPEGAEGHHVATVEAPAAGDYTIAVGTNADAIGGLGMSDPVDAGSLTVAAASNGSRSVVWGVAPAVTGIGALAVAGLAIADARRHRRLVAATT